MTPRLAARLSYVALYAAVGASFPYLGVYYHERAPDLGAIGLMTALGAAAGFFAAPIWGTRRDRPRSRRPSSDLSPPVGDSDDEAPHPGGGHGEHGDREAGEDDPTRLT